MFCRVGLIPFDAHALNPSLRRGGAVELMNAGLRRPKSRSSAPGNHSLTTNLLPFLSIIAHKSLGFEWHIWESVVLGGRWSSPAPSRQAEPQTHRHSNHAIIKFLITSCWFRQQDQSRIRDSLPQLGRLAGKKNIYIFRSERKGEFNWMLMHKCFCDCVHVGMTFPACMCCS